MKHYAIYICGDGDCPNDPAYLHRFYFGCTPKTFNERTGGAKGVKQELVEHPNLPAGFRYFWPGGCDAILRAKLDDLPPPDRSHAIVLDMDTP